VLVICQYNVILVDKCATTNTFFSLLEYNVLDITNVSKQVQIYMKFRFHCYTSLK